MRQLTCSLATIVVTLCSASQAFALAMHEPATTPESAYLEYADMFPSVGWMFIQDNGVDVDFGSGVLVDEHWVLTAAHSVLEFDNNPSSVYNGFEFGLGSNALTDPGESLFTSEVFVNPDYVAPENGPDLALLYFEDAFQSATPAQFYTGNVADLAGTDGSIAGFGGPGTPDTGQQPIDAQKRAGVNVVTSVNTSTGFERAIFRQPGFSTFRTLGVLGTPGDSGGGWFIEDNGDFYLTAISSLATLDIRYGSSTFGSLVTPELDWINTTIASKQEVPEPATALLLLAGAPFLGRFRRRRQSA